MEKDLNLIIGKNIRIRRRLLGFNQTALAKRLGITYQQVQNYEKGRHAVSVARLVKLSRMLDCGIEELCRNPASLGHDAALPSPSCKVMHLVNNFERIGCKDVQKQICYLVNSLADKKSL